jgi:hypothetical protein
MQKRHRTWLNSTREPVSHYQLVPGSEFLQKYKNLREVVAAVGGLRPISADLSVLPLSATMISPAMWLFCKVLRICSMHAATVASSLRQGMTTESSGGFSIR